MKIKAALGALIFGVATPVVAATTPFYNIEVVNSGTYDFKYGPFAKALSEGETPKATSMLLKNNMFNYFLLAPHQYDFGQRMNRKRGCSALQSDVCGAYWDGIGNTMASAWNHDIVYYTPQQKSLINNEATTVFTENQMIYNKIASDGVSGVGFKVDEATKTNISRHEVYGIAKFNNKTFILKSPISYTYRGQDIGGYATALTYLELDSGKILVGGYASYDRNHEDDWFEDCYGSYDYDNDYIYYYSCPSFKMQATLWLIDPENDLDNAQIIGTQAPEYYNYSTTDDELAEAAVTNLVKFNDKIVALGYLPTDEWGITSLAVYWEIALDEANNKVSFNGRKTFRNLEDPGEGDERHDYTYAQDANTQGYAIINTQYDKSVNSNYPAIFGISKFTADLNTESIYMPLENNPIRGANSVAEDINNNNFIVGFRDARGEISPVNESVARSSEGFLFDIETNKAYYLNDTICHITDSGDADCSQNGKYYFIEWAVAINDEQIVLASVYEYDSYNDWVNRENARIVTMKLVPSETAYIVDPNNKVLINTSSENPSPMVYYNRPQESFADDGNGGAIGSFILMLLGGFVGLNLFRRKKQV